MAPNGRSRSASKKRAVSIECLPEACFPKSGPVVGAVLPRCLRCGSLRLHCPGKHNEAFVRLNLGQVTLAAQTGALRHRVHPPTTFVELCSKSARDLAGSPSRWSEQSSRPPARAARSPLTSALHHHSPENGRAAFGHIPSRRLRARLPSPTR